MDKFEITWDKKPGEPVGRDVIEAASQTVALMRARSRMVQATGRIDRNFTAVPYKGSVAQAVKHGLG